MWRRWSIFCLVAAVCVSGAAVVQADDKEPRHQIKDGIDGKVKNVDVENKKLTIVTDQGRERTFTITDETMMAGPRGGKVRRHLKDARFHEGFPVTIVAEGNMASEVHLGFAREVDAEKSEHAKTAKTESRPSGKGQETGQTRVSKRISPAEERASIASKTGSKVHEAKKLEEEDDESEIPGKIKSFDARKRILVLSLLNGKTRSFLLPRDVAVEVGGTASKRGLDDPALKAGATVTVLTDDGGRKVKELKLVRHGWFRKTG
jgi:hypothetical protein